MCLVFSTDFSKLRDVPCLAVCSMVQSESAEWRGEERS